MAVDPARIHDLQVRAVQFTGAGAYLNEALQATRRPRRTGGPDMRPVEALELLYRMQGTPFANKDAQKLALGLVGEWLEARLLKTPEIEAATLATELGWLKRLAVYEAALQGKPGGGKDGPKPTPKQFGSHISTIRKRREAALTPPPPAPAISNPAPEPPAAPPPPRALTNPLGVRFADFKQANEAWKTARRQASRGREIKDRPFGLLSAEPLPTGTTLTLSLARTEGLADVFAALHAKGGRSLPFRATAFEGTTGGPILVTRVEPEAG